MDTLDKYELIISKIQEMCTSTVAMAPYPVGATSVTTYKYGRSKSKGNKEGKMPTPRKAIVEELIKQCKGNQKNNVLLGYRYKKVRGNNMSIYETMKEIAAICEAMYWGGKEVTPDEYRANLEYARKEAAENLKNWEAEKNKSTIDKIKDGIQNLKGRLSKPAHREAISKLIDGMKAIKGNKENINCALSEEEEEQQKPKHWTQNQPSKSNMYYVNKFGKGRNKNNYQRGQDIIRGSYKNYQTNKELPKYLEDTELMNKAINILNHAYSQKGAGIGRAFAAAQKAGIPRGVFHYLIQQRKQGGTN